MAKIPVLLRAYVPTDANFVFASWLNAFEPHRDPGVARDLYYQEQHVLIANLMAASTETRLVAVAPDYPDQILGYLFGVILPVGKVIDWLYVKPIYRRLGVARALLTTFGDPREGVAAYTHVPASPPALIRRLAPGAVYDPYLLVNR